MKLYKVWDKTTDETFECETGETEAMIKQAEIEKLGHDAVIITEEYAIVDGKKKKILIE
ncbi:MAG: hypothetical protein WC774_04690 [Candidatus Gracilibacteria bacterium]|jgi:hypothetical protein